MVSFWEVPIGSNAEVGVCTDALNLFSPIPFTGSEPDSGLIGRSQEERGPSSTRAAPLPSHGPRVRNSASKSGVGEIWIVMAA